MKLLSTLNRMHARIFPLKIISIITINLLIYRFYDNICPISGGYDHDNDGKYQNLPSKFVCVECVLQWIMKKAGTEIRECNSNA